MASILHGGSCHGFHHNHSHSHGSDLLKHQSLRSNGETKEELPIDDSNSCTVTQSECKSENINVEAAFLHVLGDFIQSIGVIIAAVIIKLYVSRGEFIDFPSISEIRFVAAESENRRSNHNIFFLNHCGCNDCEDFQKVCCDSTRGSS